ncbi:MAG: glycosyltransferase [Saprospiraceae bacterium]|nr:glycosyltransferase [Saprospiraceae bacterium]
MRILIILAQYYPMLNPNVYRWSAIAEYWVAEGHEVHVLCTKRGGTENNSTINGVQVHRAGYATLLDWAYNLLGTRRRRAEISDLKMQKQSLFRQILEWLVDHTWRMFYWPDGSCLWYFSGKRRALQLQTLYYFDIIISISLPFTANLIASAVKKQFPDIKWVMDIEDPFAFSEEFWVNNFILYRKKNFWAEAQLLRLADAVSVTVYSAKKAYLQHFSELNLKEKIKVIPPLINSFQNIGHPLLGFFSKNQIHLAYFGTFYDKVRMPDTFLLLLQQIFIQFPDLKPQLLMHFFGEIPAKAQAVFNEFIDLKENLLFHGLVGRQTVAAAIQQADFLVNIGNITNYHLPSKSAEYLSSGKPIINICQDSKDTFQNFMQEYPLICNISTYNQNWSELAKQMVTFIKENHNESVPVSLIRQLVQPYTISAVAGAYLKMTS